MKKKKIKVNTLAEHTQLKIKSKDGEVICYIVYNKAMNVLLVYDEKNRPLKWVPLGGDMTTEEE
jgi:hypothetical protein